jgi:hypothetical protein
LNSDDPGRPIAGQVQPATLPDRRTPVRRLPLGDGPAACAELEDDNRRHWHWSRAVVDGFDRLDACVNHGVTSRLCGSTLTARSP